MKFLAILMALVVIACMIYVGLMIDAFDDACLRYSCA
jgi:hypothetical protein